MTVILQMVSMQAYHVSRHWWLIYQGEGLVETLLFFLDAEWLVGWLAGLHHASSWAYWCPGEALYVRRGTREEKKKERKKKKLLDTSVKVW